MKPFYVLLIFAINFTIISFVVSPKKALKSGGDVWKILLSLKYKVEFNDKSDDVIFVPLHNDAVDSIDGKIIYLDGYFLDNRLTSNSKKSKLLYFSYYQDPFNVCAGLSISSIIGVKLLRNKKLSNEQKYTLKGKLNVNWTNYKGLAFYLTEVECLNCN